MSKPDAQTPDVPVELRHFVELFNRTAFWDSHEALEDAWRATGSEFYHGLILYASAFVHAQRGNRHGILAQLEKAERRLCEYRPFYLGVDLDVLLEHARRCRRTVEEDADAGRDEWAKLIEFPRIGLSQRRVRGNEDELRGAEDTPA